MAGNRQRGDEPFAPARRCDRVRLRVHPIASLAVVALAALLGGCASHSGGPRSDDLVCTSAQQCRVKVEVTCAPACRATIDHPRVFARGHDVVWAIENRPGQSYVFRRESGIAFKTEAGRDVFRCHVEANGNRYTCMNRRTPGAYEYDVRLDGSPPVPPLDPWVVN